MRPRNTNACPSPSTKFAAICTAAFTVWSLVGCTPVTIPANQVTDTTNENVHPTSNYDSSSTSNDGPAADNQSDPPEATEHTSGNVNVNYADRALCAGDEDFDYFYSSAKGGICRARTDGSATDVIVPIGLHCYISWLNLDNDQLFYLGQTYGDDEDVFGIHVVNTDGSDKRVIYTPDGESDIQGVYVYDHTVYVLTMANDSYDVWTMDEDGSNQQRIAQDLASGGESPFLTSDAIYYVTNPGGKRSGGGTPDELYVQDLDGADARRLYTSSLGRLGSPVPGDGPGTDGIFITELGQEGTDTAGSRLTWVQADGSEVRTVYSSSENKELQLVNLTGKSAYLLQDIGTYDSYFGRLLIATYDSNYAHAINLPTSYASHNLERGGKYVLDFCNGVPDIGMAVYALDFDASFVYKMCDYVTEDLAETESKDIPQNEMSYDLTDNSGATVTELTGTLRARYVDTDETGMDWGATEYVLDLPSPTAVIFESYGNTRIGNDIVDVVQVSSAENSLALGETEPKTDPTWEPYVGKVVTLTCTGAFDSGTGHVIFSPALRNPTVARVY